MADRGREEMLEERVKKLEAAAPGVGDIMSNVQTHFAKLFFAADGKNWRLAEFEIHEVSENLEKAAVLRPEENGVQLKGVFDAFEQTQLAALRRAVEKANAKMFAESYRDATTMCNACHNTTGRPFVTITRPVAPPVPNQQWTPVQEK